MAAAACPSCPEEDSFCRFAAAAPGGSPVAAAARQDAPAEVERCALARLVAAAAQDDFAAGAPQAAVPAVRAWSAESQAHEPAAETWPAEEAQADEQAVLAWSAAVRAPGSVVAVVAAEAAVADYSPAACPDIAGAAALAGSQMAGAELAAKDERFPTVRSGFPAE